MRSLEFPQMFNSNSSRVRKESDYLQSTYQNLKLLLMTECGEMAGDPYFGTMLKHYLFDQNSYILRDILIDMLYTKIAIFIPQLHVERSDITITQNKKEKGKVYITIHGINQIDFKPNTYNLTLYTNENAAV